MEEVAKEIGLGLVGRPEQKKHSKNIQKKLKYEKLWKKISCHVPKDFCWSPGLCHRGKGLADGRAVVLYMLIKLASYLVHHHHHHLCSLVWQQKPKKKFLKTVFMSRKISLMDHLAFVTSWVNQPLGRVPKSIRCASNVMRSWLHWVKVVPWWDPLNGFWVALSTIKSQTNTLTGKQQREGGGGGQETKQAFLSW